MGLTRFYCSASLVLASAWAKVPTATTNLGTYAGRHLPSFDQDLFLGIPYADAPILENPRPINEPWGDTRPADAYGPACLFNAPPVFEQIGIGQSADCLNLNIIRPSGFEDQALPVVVWFHGGGFAIGTGADPGTNTSYVVQASVENEMPIMAVTFNYRLGFLGFPGGPQSAAAGITNLGLKDQRMALIWIQENIAAFGGDPRKVTAWGQSAGAMSVALQILAYGGEGADELLHRGILVSGAPFGANALFPTHPMCVEGYESALGATGCTDADNTLQCLRDSPAEVISKNTTGNPFAFWPSIDGDFIQEPPAWQLNKGLFSKEISIITGANDDEGLISAGAFGVGVETDEDMTEMLRTLFPAARESTIQKILEAYTLDAPNPPYALPMDETFCEAMVEANLSCAAQHRRVAAVLGDQAQISGSRVLAKTWAAQGRTAYRYRFDTYPTSIPIVLDGNAPGFATHSAEYAYFFGFPPDFDRGGTGPTVVNATPHRSLSRGIVDMFVSFIATGDPNTFGVEDFPEWPAYSVEAPANIVLNATLDALNVHIEPDTWRGEGMALWETYGIELQFESNWRP